MTEAEWLTCEDPEAMLGHVPVKTAHDRKRCLAAAAFCRRIWDLLYLGSRRGVEGGGLLADGPIDFWTALSARQDAGVVHKHLRLLSDAQIGDAVAGGQDYDPSNDCLAEYHAAVAACI